MKYLPWLVLVVTSTLLTLEAKKTTNSVDGDDFEFVNEADASAKSTMERKKWIHDPSNDLCKPLNCKKKELCLLEDAYTAVCVSKKELQQEEYALARDSDSDKEDFCNSCPPTKPMFMCGTDNKTYSSLCRLKYHNCIHATQIKVSCHGFCPCKSYENEKVGAVMKHDEKKRPSSHFKRKYSFTPEDINYDNKHYKFIKFSTQDRISTEGFKKPKDITQEHHKFVGASVKKELITSNKFPSKNNECRDQQLNAMGNRLLDWFSVIMADSNKKKRHNGVAQDKDAFPSSCKIEVVWMFNHLDISPANGFLSKQELYDLEHDQEEKCIKPFLNKCDLNQDKVIDPREWCKCYEHFYRKCEYVKRLTAMEDFNGYAPDCDEKGFYKPTQCHNSAGMMICWCVDRHGIEFDNTRGRNKPNCDDVLFNGAAKSEISVIKDDDNDDDEDDESVEEGSASKLLVF